jgi:peptidoglycan hydrolase CwlO-like protein
MKEQIQNKIEKLSAKVEMLKEQYGENSPAVYRYGDELQALIEELTLMLKWEKSKKERGA